MVRFHSEAPYTDADVAQLAEQLICNQQVAGSSPIISSIFLFGRVPEWPKGADCKSAVFDFGGSNPPSSTKILHLTFVRCFFCYKGCNRFTKGVILC